MGKIRDIFKNWRVIILLVLLLFSVLAISYNPMRTGVIINSVEFNSSAALAGMESPDSGISPVAKERIIQINTNKIENIVDYESAVSNLEENQTVKIKTNKKSYTLIVRPKYNITYTDELEEVAKNVTIDNKTVESIELKNKTIKNKIGIEDIGLKVSNAPKSNIQKGIDLQGGTRILLQPEIKLDEDNYSIVLDIIRERVNGLGLKDVVVKKASDLSGNQYILVEVSGENDESLVELLQQQGKFEAKIGDEVAFSGGGNDVTYICRGAECSGLDPNYGCRQVDKLKYNCRFRFQISLSSDAAQRQAEITDKLDIITNDDGSQYLSEPLKLYVDDNKRDELSISASLKGKAETDILITGSGEGNTQDMAYKNTLGNMKNLQTILKTGSMPVKLNLVNSDNISPTLGEKFISSTFLIVLFAILGIFSVVMLRYKNLKIALGMSSIMFSELVMLLGVSALIRWNLDLASIAGIMISVGTGVDDLIVIADETLTKSEEKYDNWKSKLKKAFFIITAAYFTTVFAMGFLFFAGAGLLKGFALLTIIGVTIGVFISRPVFGVIMEKIL